MRIFLPASALEILIDDVAGFALEILGQEILEGAAPKIHDSVVTEDLGEVFEFHVPFAKDRAEMIVEHFLETFAPFVTAEEFHQPVEIMAGRH
ncbi:hypothetical protein [Mesorhizobium sp.]|uniref:hypothetical protein n=1 Tax=Mesorhizobium sp. TaxID=1871066 RepID=UPI00257DFBF5|nr:hypothetical protein [Mesorhizobium sp.]